MDDLHSSDINTVDWSGLNQNLIATGSNDTLVKIIDTRKAYQFAPNSVVKVLEKHQAKVQTVKFSPFDSRYLASTGDSIIIWDLGLDFENQANFKEEQKRSDSYSSSGSSEENIILNHIGHIGTVSDFDWNPVMPWIIMSASDDSETFV